MGSQVEWVTCYKAGCGYSPFPMERGLYDRCVETHEDFICPNGHRQQFAGESQRERAGRLERRIEHYRLVIVDLRDMLNQARCRCPWTGCGFQSTSEQGRSTHMQRMHGMPTLAALEEAS